MPSAVIQPSSPFYSVGPSARGSEAIATTALELAASQGARYAFGQAPTSRNPELSGNKNPGVSVLTWLKNRYKCNQFVGDSLYQAGYEMPTYRMSDGTKHYLNAEALPRQTAYFERIPSFRQARPGDLVVFDRLNSVGEDGAHVEVITGLTRSTGQLLLTGARAGGAGEKDYSALLNAALVTPSQTISILRPKRPLELR